MEIFEPRLKDAIVKSVTWETYPVFIVGVLQSKKTRMGITLTDTELDSLVMQDSCVRKNRLLVKDVFKKELSSEWKIPEDEVTDEDLENLSFSNDPVPQTVGGTFALSLMEDDIKRLCMFLLEHRQSSPIVPKYKLAEERFECLSGANPNSFAYKAGAFIFWVVLISAMVGGLRALFM